MRIIYGRTPKLYAIRRAKSGAYTRPFNVRKLKTIFGLLHRHVLSWAIYFFIHEPYWAGICGWCKFLYQCAFQTVNSFDVLGHCSQWMASLCATWSVGTFALKRLGDFTQSCYNARICTWKINLIGEGCVLSACWKAGQCSTFVTIKYLAASRSLQR